MGEIRINITRTDKEWEIILAVIEQRYKGKNPSGNGRGRGINQFVANEVNKAFSKVKDKACEEVTAVHVRKTFRITTSDEVSEKIECVARKLCITTGALIGRIAIDPHLLDYYD